MPRHIHLMDCKTNKLPVFDHGNIVYDNCSDCDKRLLDKAQLSVAKLILGCLKTTSFDDVLTDLNLTSLHLRWSISLRRYFFKLVVEMEPCPFPASCFRSLNEFVS